MYTRKYTDDERELSIPSGYDGIALRQESDSAPTDCAMQDTEDTRQCASEPAEHDERDRDDSILAGIPFLGKFKDNFIFGKGAKFDIGFEEILIAALALYLFFSKDGDKECAIMLAILLFIT